MINRIVLTAIVILSAHGCAPPAKVKERSLSKADGSTLLLAKYEQGFVIAERAGDAQEERDHLSVGQCSNVDIEMTTPSLITVRYDRMEVIHYSNITGSKFEVALCAKSLSGCDVTAQAKRIHLDRCDAI